MDEKFRGKYRTVSARASWWDYGSNAAYFVTICTKNRIHYFGQVIQGEMQLSEIGIMADTCWQAIPEHFPFVKLGNHIIMPNHVHGIIIIDKMDDERMVETQNLAFLRASSTNTPKNKFGPQSQNLASIIRGFKIGVTKSARRVQPNFTWQSRYHDHVIRNEKSFRNISRYITNNPRKWSEDRFFAKN
ncbi:transposase [Tunicatimonas pelagia]|uniref:transposase n=1 Tax=Tunicatimonas pelagia TaxID=931531 RepID=UPI002665A9B0|nr:transposase [Tunicatimonas pelagia]WKN41101.1 transposase [Tunicatimonas pelagia]